MPRRRAAVRSRCVNVANGVTRFFAPNSPLFAAGGTTLAAPKIAQKKQRENLTEQERILVRMSSNWQLGVSRGRVCRW